LVKRLLSLTMISTVVAGPATVADASSAEGVRFHASFTRVDPSTIIPNAVLSRP